MLSPDTTDTDIEPTTEIESPDDNLTVEALHVEAVAIAEIEDRLDRIIREQGIETPLTKPPDAKRVAASTFQAVAYVLREYGMSRLNDPWLTSRLVGFSDAQIKELVAALKRMQPRSAAITDVLIAEIAKLEG